MAPALVALAAKLYGDARMTAIASDPEIDARLQLAKSLACEAGRLALSFFQSLSELEIESKGVQDMVSNADRDVETFIREKLAEAFPQVIGHIADRDPGGLPSNLTEIADFRTPNPQFMVPMFTQKHTRKAIGGTGMRVQDEFPCFAYRNLGKDKDRIYRPPGTNAVIAQQSQIAKPDKRTGRDQGHVAGIRGQLFGALRRRQQLQFQ